VGYRDEVVVTAHDDDDEVVVTAHDDDDDVVVTVFSPPPLQTKVKYLKQTSLMLQREFRGNILSRELCSQCS
jgi:hypothetical protein